MKPAAILSLGLLGAITAYAAIYFTTTAPARAALCSNQPELAWLKQEFKIDDAQFARICEMHAAYLPKCRELCARIQAKNAVLSAKIAKTNAITADMDKEMTEIAQLQADCRKNMLDHFLAVSRAMPPEQARRYLEWVTDQTIFCAPGQAKADCHPPK